MAQIMRTRTTNNTWGGRPATLVEYHLDKSRLGLRITTFQFEGENDVEVKLVKGDGRRPNFVERAHLVVTPPEVAEAIEHFMRNPG